MLTVMIRSLCLLIVLVKQSSTQGKYLVGPFHITL
jgi:hypothetical protein